MKTCFSGNAGNILTGCRDMVNDLLMQRKEKNSATLSKLRSIEIQECL